MDYKKYVAKHIFKCPVMILNAIFCKIYEWRNKSEEM